MHFPNPLSSPPYPLWFSAEKMRQSRSSGYTLSACFKIVCVVISAYRFDICSLTHLIWVDIALLLCFGGLCYVNDWGVRSQTFFRTILVIPIHTLNLSAQKNSAVHLYVKPYRWHIRWHVLIRWHVIRWHVLMGGSLFTITFPLTPSERSFPFPIILHGMFYSLCLFIHCPSIYSPRYPLHYSLSPHISCTRSLFFTPTITPRSHSPLPFPTIPSTALRSEYPFKFQKWNFQQYSRFTHTPETHQSDQERWLAIINFTTGNHATKVLQTLHK